MPYYSDGINDINAFIYYRQMWLLCIINILTYNKYIIKNLLLLAYFLT